MNQNKWVNEAIFYHIYPLGFTGAPRINEGTGTTGSRILKVLDWIPYLNELGINAIYFGPVFESETHGYDTSDYYQTDRRLGTKEEFKQVFDTLHNHGIRVVLDGVFNHVGRSFMPFQDVRRNREGSVYKDWFCGIDFHQYGPAGDGFSYETWQGNAELVKLNLRNQQVVEYLLGAVAMWIDELGIDGLRLDAADCVEMEYFRKLRAFTHAKRQDFWLMGEIIHGDYNVWANNTALDSVTNYECWKGIYSSHNDKNYFEIAYALKRQFGEHGIYKDLYLYNFADNHDVSRVASLLTRKEHLENVYTLLFTMPGVPSLYYGSEWGIEGMKASGMNADIPLRPCIELTDAAEGDTGLLEHIRELAAVRKSSDALKYGNYQEVLVRNEQLIFARETDSDRRLIVLNLSDKASQLQFTYAGKTYDVEAAAFSSEIFY